jgi:hypothetical protein
MAMLNNQRVTKLIPISPKFLFHRGLHQVVGGFRRRPQTKRFSDRPVAGTKQPFTSEMISISGIWMLINTCVVRFIENITYINFASLKKIASRVIFVE